MKTNKLTKKQIEAMRTPQGGWTKEQLAKWGVSWPPPKGWKKLSRARDYAYEALAESTGSSQTAARGELNAALKSIRDQSEITDSYVLADEIHTRAKLYRQVMPDVMLTPSALAKHWRRVFEEAERKPKQTNTHAAVTECSTCGGDRFVLVGTRPAKQSSWMAEHKIQVPEVPGMEEYAACPDCNQAADTDFHRADGSKSRPLDPAEVRERMRG